MADAAASDSGALEKGAPPVPARPRRRVVGRPRVRFTAAGLAQSFQQSVLRSFVGDGWPSWNQWGGGAITPRVAGAVGDTEELADGYLQEAWVAGCTDLRSLAALLAVPRIWDRDPGDEAAQEVLEGPVYDLLVKEAHPAIDAERHRIHDVQNMLLANESFWFMQDENGDPVGSLGNGPAAGRLIDVPAMITPVRGDLVQLDEFDGSGPIWWKVPRADTTRQHHAGGGTVRWPAWAALSLFEHPDPRPERPFRGIGRLAKAYGPAAQLHLARRYQNFLLRNGGDPGGFVVLDGTVGPEEEERLRDEMADEWGDPENAGEWRLLQGNAKVERGRQTPKDLEYGDLRTASKDDIAAVFSVPGAVLGQDAVNFATFAGHWRTFVSLGVRPELQLRAQTINRRLISRLRDPQQSRFRLRYDTEVLEGLFDDLADKVKTAKELTEIGVPLDEALRQAGIKADPIEGGDVPVVRAGVVDRQAAIVLSRAKAAEALQNAGVEPAAALGEVGLGHLPLAPAPDSGSEPGEPGSHQGSEPGEPGAEEDSEASEDDAKALPARVGRDWKALGGVPLVLRADNDGREAARSRFEKHLRGPRRRMAQGVRRVFREMGTAQKRAFEQFAEEGRIDRVAVYEGLAVRLADGDDLAPLPPVWPAGSRDHDELRADLEALTKAELTEAEIDSLIILADARWIDALFDRIHPITADLYGAMAEDVSTMLGVGTIDLENPMVLKKLRDHAVQVVEGTTSVVARRMRSDLIRVLADQPTLPTLQETIRESLLELKATTTRAFKDHHARALAIARTETGRAANQGSFDQLVQSHNEGAIDQIEWLTSGQAVEPDGPVREEHHEAEGKRTTPGIPFRIGGHDMLHPHDPTAPAHLVVNCVCSIRGVVEDDDAADS